MRARTVLETVLYADDIPAAEQFYCSVLGLERWGGTPGHSAMLRCGGQMVLIFNPHGTRKQTLDADPPIPAHGADGAGHVCFSASRTEIDDWRAHLIAHGVPIESEFEWPGGGYSLYFRDPAGNSVEFAEPKLWGLPA